MCVGLGFGLGLRNEGSAPLPNVGSSHSPSRSSPRSRAERHYLCFTCTPYTLSYVFGPPFHPLVLPSGLSNSAVFQKCRGTSAACLRCSFSSRCCCHPSAAAALLLLLLLPFVTQVLVVSLCSCLLMAGALLGPQACRLGQRTAHGSGALVPPTQQHM
jgi:hypothetical protein